MSNGQVHVLRQALPTAIEAEREILGGILLKAAAYDEIADVLRPADFSHPAHAAIYEAMGSLALSSRPIDPITVAEQMRAADTDVKLRAIGGEVYFAELMSGVVTVENVGYHARIVADCARRTRVMSAADELRARAFRGGEGWDDEGGSILWAALEQRRLETSATAREIARTLSDEVAARCDGRATGIPTGLAKLDEILGGIQSKRQYVIAARPSLGKTSLVANLCSDWAASLGIPAILFSLEMPRESLLERMVCAEARIDTQHVASGRMSSDDWMRWTRALSRIAGAPITVDDDATPTLVDLRSRVRRWRAAQTVEQQKRPAIVAIDYLQLVDSQRAKGETLADAIGRVSRGIRAIAKETNTATLVLSQLNRESEKGDRRPRLSDLRDSGAIEADADAVVFLHRPDEKKAIELEAIVGKNRHGATGIAKVAFHRQWTRFDNLSSRDEELPFSPPPPEDYQQARRRPAPAPAREYGEVPFPVEEEA